MPSDPPTAPTTQPFHDAGDPLRAGGGFTLVSGTRVGHYTIRRTLGRGGMGATVFEAIQDSPERLVALKVLPRTAGDETIDRFRREADALARVHHPNVASVYESGIEPGADGVAFMAMELVVGAQPIDDYVRERSATLSLRRRVELMINVCSAVAEAHRLGVVHRDLKPGNVLVSVDGVAKVVDFGIATAVSSEVLGAPLPIIAPPPHGTPAYMSPEQIRGDVGRIDARTDVYALGAILFELLTGRTYRTFDRADSSHASLTAAAKVAPTPPSKWNRDLPRDADRLVLRALATDPAERFADAGALERALRDLLNDRAPLERAEPASVRTARTFRHACRTFPRLTLLLAVFIGAVAGWIALQPPVIRAIGFWRFEPALARAAQARSAMTSMRDVTMVTLDDAFGPDQMREAMQAHGIDPDPTSRASTRRLHCVLIDRLIEADVKAIAFDIGFVDDSAGDADLAAAARRAEAHGIPVLCVAPDWNEQTGTGAAFRDAFRLGGAEAEVGPAAWQLHLAREAPSTGALKSLPLTTWLAARSPKARWEVQLDWPETIILRAFEPTGGVDGTGHPREKRGETITLHQIPIEGPWNGTPTPSSPLSPRLRVLIPSDDVLRKSTMRYADVVGPQADPAAIHGAFSRRIALVGDLRTGREARHPYFDGRSLPAFYAIAVGIECLQTMVGDDVFPFEKSAVVFALIGLSLAGVVLARSLRRSPPARIAPAITSAAIVVIAFAIVAFVIAFALAWFAQWQINPGPLVVAGLVGFLAGRRVLYASRPPLS